VRTAPVVFAVVVVILAATQWRRVGWPLRLGAAAVAAGFALYGAGVVVDLPNAEKLLLDVGRTFGHRAYVVVAGLAFLETGAFVGLLTPGEFAVIAGGVFAGQGNLEVVLLLALVWVACICGDSLSFYLGRRLGRGFLLRHGPRVRITEDRMRQVEGFFARRGGVTILIGRFIGFVRPIAPFIAGASKMSYRRFLPYDVAGAGLWSTTFVLLGYFSWRNIDTATAIASRGTLGVGTGVAVVVAALLAHRFLRTAEQRTEARRWLRTHAVARRRHNEPG
jgi:undecaprenyl-diphosphatase